jgi:hypothetical protein
MLGIARLHNLLQDTLAAGAWRRITARGTHWCTPFHPGNNKPGR